VLYQAGLLLRFAEVETASAESLKREQHGRCCSGSIPDDRRFTRRRAHSWSSCIEVGRRLMTWRGRVVGRPCDAVRCDTMIDITSFFAYSYRTRPSRQAVAHWNKKRTRDSGDDRVFVKEGPWSVGRWGPCCFFPVSSAHGPRRPEWNVY
jgi:hypothetical protein